MDSFQEAIASANVDLNWLLKGYLRYKNIFCNKVALDV